MFGSNCSGIGSKSQQNSSQRVPLYSCTFVHKRKSLTAIISYLLSQNTGHIHPGAQNERESKMNIFKSGLQAV